MTTSKRKSSRKKVVHKKTKSKTKSKSTTKKSKTKSRTKTKSKSRKSRKSTKPRLACNHSETIYSDEIRRKLNSGKEMIHIKLHHHYKNGKRTYYITGKRKNGQRFMKTLTEKQSDCLQFTEDDKLVYFA